jgi:hypothetical protein
MNLRRFVWIDRGHPAWVAIAAFLTLAGCELNLDGGASRRGAAPDEQWAVRLWEDKRPGHAQRIGQIKDELARRTGWDDLWIVHEDHGSTLYWGTFPSPSSSKAQKRLQEARAWRSDEGRRSFAEAILWKVSGDDELGPPEWRLSRAPGEYSVCIAVFHNVPAENFYGRKQAAVAYCRQLRESGTEAYYHHGRSRSSVTVGAFPASSVRRARRGSEDTGVGYVEQVVDPRMKAVLQRFPVMAVNGMREKVVVPTPGERFPSKQVVVKSYAVHIPREGDLESPDETDRRRHR